MNSGEIDSFEKSKVGIYSSPTLFPFSLRLTPKAFQQSSRDKGIDFFLLTVFFHTPRLITDSRFLVGQLVDIYCSGPSPAQDYVTLNICILVNYLSQALLSKVRKVAVQSCCVTLMLNQDQRKISIKKSFDWD